MSGNIFDKRGITPPEDGRTEIFEQLLSTHASKNVQIERILSFGAADGEWYEQDWDEWVMVARGESEIEWDDGKSTTVEAGDYLFLPAGKRHRVVQTSYDCVWLAVHIR